jgi:hypothetical protein
VTSFSFRVKQYPDVGELSSAEIGCAAKSTASACSPVTRLGLGLDTPDILATRRRWFNPDFVFGRKKVRAPRRSEGKLNRRIVHGLFACRLVILRLQRE